MSPSPNHPRNLIVRTLFSLMVLSIIALTAYSIYIAIHEPDPQETIVLGQLKIASGSSSCVRVLVRNRVSGKSIKDAKVTFALLNKTSGMINLGTFKTDDGGTLADSINIPEIPPGE